MTNEEYLNQALEFRREAEEGNRPVFKRMSKAERFKKGDQWDSRVLKYNESRRKLSLKINKILPTVSHISGVQIQNKRDIKAHPRPGSSARLASVLTALAKHAMDDSNANHETSFTFDDGIATARGWLGVGVDFAKDPILGNLKIKQRDPFMILPDPNRTAYDLNARVGGAKYIIEDEWVDKGFIEGRYPNKKMLLASADYRSQQPAGRFRSLVNFMFSRSGISTQDDYRDTKDEQTLTLRAKLNYRRTKTWWKDWVKGAYLFRSQFDYIVLTKASEIADARRLIEESPNGAQLIEKDRSGKPLMVPVLNVTVTVGDVFLENVEDPFNGVSLFPLIPYAPYFVNGYEFGVVENLIGPQETLNWSFSNFVNNMKNLANTGWKVTRLIGKAGDWLKAHSGEEGIILDQSKFGGKIDKLEPNPIDKGALIITEQTSKHLAEIANVRLENPTFDEKHLSGRAILLKQQASLTGSATLFGNWDYTLQLLGQLVIEFIMSLGLYSDDEIRAILDDEDLIDVKLMEEATGMVLQQLNQAGYNTPTAPEPPELKDMPEDVQRGMSTQYQEQLVLFQQFVQQVQELARPVAQQMLIGELRNVNKGRYTVKIDQSPMAPTARIAAFAELVEISKILLESGQAPIDRETLIEASDLAGKDKIIERGRQLQEQMATAGAEKQEAVK